ncbi:MULTISPECIES: hypothetical protein [Streptococcus]|uniref:hypothetical protein n=1 Tax=Streptococcus TaxID=1301 RepID=UPI00021A183C|nr:MULTISPECIES: hypothetical protein [Streptococcus]MDO4634869.1 hypothetical protein [Streptococcus sp.]HEM3667511.1 hypothetical protein [Streptococcus suis]EGS28012.1 hypothetical protein FSLSAGS3026_08420 [Streptococcus agalactiae FSL S3-026]EPV90435.1 hypothetical protein SAG0014_11375 [Streptococcus agalactiae FSL S3-586]KLL81609.1 hypothetical protein WA05_09060 [Streptococcus agalactiae]
MTTKPSNRMTIYYKEENLKKYEELKSFFEADEHINSMTTSATFLFLVDICYQLFIESNPGQSYSERLKQFLNFKNNDVEELKNKVKIVSRQLDQLLYLELTNFHTLTKGNDFDIQDLESIHSRFDPMQHELMARIDDIIKEDVARGQTMKHSH